MPYFSKCPLPKCQDFDYSLTTNDRTLLTQEILAALSTLPHDCPYDLLQFWFPKRYGKAIVLSTRSQHFGFSGSKEELQPYLTACSDHKWYVHPEERIAFGLPGLVFLDSYPAETPNVHDYIKSERPRCEDNMKLGSYIVLVFKANKHVCVLDFVTTTSKDSYDYEIGQVCSALESAGFQSPNQTCNDRPPWELLHPKERKRTTKSSRLTYNCLCQYFGRPKDNVSQELSVRSTTFDNRHRDAKIPEWPCVNTKTTRAREPETPIIQITTETSFFGTSIPECYTGNLSSSTSSRVVGSPEGSNMETMINVQMDHHAHEATIMHDADNQAWIINTGASAPETHINQATYEVSIHEASWITSERERADFMSDMDEQNYEGGGTLFMTNIGETEYYYINEATNMHGVDDEGLPDLWSGCW